MGERMEKALRTIPGLLINITAFLLMSCSIVSADGPLKVAVSIVPQKYFVEKIGGDLVHVSVMVPPGSSPATYEPRPQQMVGLTRSRLYLAVGVPFEEVWLEKFLHVNPEMMIVHIDEGIEKMPMKARDQHDEEAHHHGIKDPHIWLSPPLVMIQARNILWALMKADPESKEAYKANYRAFMEELVALDLQLTDMFSGEQEGGRFMVYHPAWGYFAQTYGLEQIPIEKEGKAPKAKALQNLVDHAGEEGIKAIFVQPQVSSKSAQTIAQAIGCRVVSADPLAEDWAKNLLDVAERFKSSQK